MKNFDSFRKELNDLFIHFDPADYLDPQVEVDNFDDLTDMLEEVGCFEQQDVIYYHKAMQLLSEYDNSLNISLGIAAELAYTTENINSELLATLLLQELCRDEWAENREEVEELLTKYSEEELNEELESELI